MPTVLTSSQQTFVDITDQRKLSAYITSNLPKSQIEDPNVLPHTYAPDWASTPLTLTPVVFLDQTNLALDASGLTISWKRKEGNGAEAALTSGESVSKGVLTVNANKLAAATSGMLTYLCYISYYDSETKNTVNISADITYTLIRNAQNAKLAYLAADTYVFKYDANSSLVGAKQATVNAIIGNEKYTGDVLFQKTYTDNSFNRHQNRGELDQYLMQDHHEAIISREEFELANAVLKQRGREKGNGHDTGRYQNRYGFSGRICCEECGGKYKRRMHYKPSGQYVAWTCVNHLKDKESCSQKYITDDALKLAFVTMMNKLVFGHQLVLRPLLQSLRGLNDQSRLLKIEELETAIEKNREQKQVLTNLMASGYLEPALFNKESNELAAEAEALRQEKDGLMRSVNGDMVKIEELQRLLRFTSKGTMMTEFDDEIFLSFVERITVLSRKEVVFELKCGLSLRERLVEP